jgi:hypothetical protein
VIVIVNLPGVQSHPQPDLFFRAMHSVVREEFRYEFLGQGFDKDALRRDRRDHDENAITSIFVITVGPRDADIAERLHQDAVKAGAHRDLMEVGPAPVSEPCHVHDKDRPVHCRSRICHEDLNPCDAPTPVPISMRASCVPSKTRWPVPKAEQGRGC